MSTTNTTIMDTLIAGKSPWGIYDASLWNSTTNTLPEARGNGRNVSSSGTITFGTETGNGATGTISYLGGTTTSSLTWPSGSIPANFTICSITRYNGGVNGRILQSTTNNFFHGHYNGRRGVIHYGGWGTTPNISVGTLTNWLNCCGKNGGTIPNNILIDGIASGAYVPILGNSTLTINNGFYSSDISNWKFSYLVIYDTQLTDNEMVRVSNKLSLYLSTGSFYTTNTTIMDTLIAGKSPWGIYDASLWNSTTNTLPEARGNGRDVLGGGTITSGVGTGTGATASIPYISGGTTSTLTWPAGSIPTKFTLCAITRFVDTTGNRILTSNTFNFVQGAININLGVAYYGNVYKTSATAALTAGVNKINWFVSCGKNGLSTDNGGTDTIANSVLSNSLPVGTSFGGLGNGVLCVNANPSFFPSYSNWSFTYTVIYDSVLTDAEMLTVSKKLQLYLDKGSFYTPVLCGGQSNSVVLGFYDSKTLQGMNSISIGVNAGQTAQGNNAIAIGNSTAGSTQGNYSIAIGAFAGQTSQPANSIVLNASGNSLNGATASATYISPIRSIPFISGSSALRYDATGKEVFTTGLPICASILYGFASNFSLGNNINAPLTAAPFTSLLRSYNFSITGLSMSGGVLTNTSGYTIVVNVSAYVNFQNVSGYKEVWIQHSVLGKIGDYSIATNDANTINATFNAILLNGENIFVALYQSTGSTITVNTGSHLSITVLSH